MGARRTVRCGVRQTRWLVPVMVLCVACLHFGAGASAASWTSRPVPAPALGANGELVSVSCVPAGPCVAVGYFASPGGGDRPLTEIRRGSRWSIQATPAPAAGVDEQLNAVACPGRRSCMAVGYSVLGSGASIPLAERWNGSSWSVLPAGDPSGGGGQLSAISCPSAAFCIAVGSSSQGALIERWNGGRWSPQRSTRLGAGSQLDAVSCPVRRTCVAVGSARHGGVAERWAGRRWSQLPSPARIGGLKAISCTSPEACSAIGDTDEQYGVQRWNGRRWTSETVPAQACDPSEICSNILSSISCVSMSTCYLAGAFDIAVIGSSGQDTTTPRAASWHGSAWRDERVRNVGVCPTRNTDVCGTSLIGISCTAHSRCITVGMYSDATGVGQPLIEHRHADAWSPQPAPSPLGPASSQLNAVSCSSATACTAVGSYTAAGPENSPDIPSFLLAERWNGATWTIQPTPGAGGLSGVSCPSVNACTAVGAGRIQTWNGTTWTAVPTPATSDSRRVGGRSRAACPGLRRGRQDWIAGVHTSGSSRQSSKTKQDGPRQPVSESRIGIRSRQCKRPSWRCLSRAAGSCLVRWRSPPLA